MTPMITLYTTLLLSHLATIFLWERKKNANRRSTLYSPQVASSLFFQYNEALKPPYSVLVDTNFINHSIQSKLDLMTSMMDTLYAKSTPVITDCVMAELEKLGQKYRIALRIARDPRFERLKCDHKGTYADDCIVNRVMAHKCYIVATNDKDLKRRIRKVCLLLPSLLFCIQPLFFLLFLPHPSSFYFTVILLHKRVLYAHTHIYTYQYTTGRPPPAKNWWNKSWPFHPQPLDTRCTRHDLWQRKIHHRTTTRCSREMNAESFRWSSSYRLFVRFFARPSNLLSISQSLLWLNRFRGVYGFILMILWHNRPSTY